MMMRARMTKKDRLELKKLELEIAEAEFRRSILDEKDKLERGRTTLEISKLGCEVDEKKLLNDHKRETNALEIKKANLEVKEKQIATRYAIPTAVWEVLKYLVAVVPVMATLIGLYLTYEKDTRVYRHQLELEKRFKIDSDVVKLINQLSAANPADAVNAAVLLAAYGRAAARIAIPHLKLTHEASVYPFLVQSLVDVIALESNEDRYTVATEIVQRLSDQTETVIQEFLKNPSDLNRDYVVVHLEAFVQLGKRCAPVCKILLAALKNGAERIKGLVGRLKTDNQQVLTAAAEVKDMLALAEKN